MNHEVVDLDHAELDRRGAVRSTHHYDIVALRRMNTEHGCVTFGQRNHRSARVDHEIEPAAVNAAFDVEMSVAARRDEDRKSVV